QVDTFQEGVNVCDRDVAGTSRKSTNHRRRRTAVDLGIASSRQSCCRMSCPVGVPSFHYSGGNMKKRLVLLVTVAFALLATLPTINGQSVTGQIAGTVADAAGAVVPGAVVNLTNALSQQVHTFSTDANGGFVFTGLVPGDYNI